MNIGNRIRDRRESLEITQHALAMALGLTPQYVSQIENGLKIPSLTLAARLAEQLGTSIDYLVSGEEGVLKSAVSAIKAEKELSLKAKRALVALVEELQGLSPRGGP